MSDIEGKPVVPPETIEFGGVMYGKIEEFLEKINGIIADVEFDIKGSQKLSEEEDEPLYYEGHWVGMDAVRVDYLYPLKEEYEERIK